LFCRIVFCILRELPLTIFEILFQQSVHCHCLFDHDFGRVEVFRLKTAEFFQRAMEGALRGRTGAIDRDLKAVEFFVGQAFRRRHFEIRATTEAPCGVDDFAGKRLFERRGGREFCEIAGFEVIEDVVLFGADEIGDGEQAEFGGVFGYLSFTCGRDRAVGPFGVLPIGQDLGGGCHGSVNITQRSTGVWLNCWKHSRRRP